MPTSTAPGRIVRPWAWLGIAGLGVGVLVLGLLHVIGPTADISPLRRTISEYQLTDVGWAFNVGVLAVALGSSALLIALVGARLTGAVGAVLLAGWIGGLLVLTVFPKHNWAIGPSVTGQVHRVASLVAFLALPLAILCIAWRPRSRLTGPGCWVATGLALGSLLWFVPIVVAIAGHSAGGRPWWQAIQLGLVERGLALTEILALVVVGVTVIRSPVGAGDPTDPESAQPTLAAGAAPATPW